MRSFCLALLFIAQSYLFSSEQELFFPNNCWYFSMAGGATFRSSQPMGNGTKTFFPAPTMQGAIGYQWNEYFGVEGEAGIRTTPLKKVTDTLATSPLTTEETTFNLMVNGYVTPCAIKRVSPYVGVGVGYANQAYGIHVSPNPPSGSHPKTHTHNFAYQAIAGLLFPVDTGLDFAIEYRFFSIPDLHYRSVRSHFHSHDLLLRLVYGFNECYNCELTNVKNSNFYITSKMGSNWRSEESFGSGGKKRFFTGPAYAAAVGYQLCSGIGRVEFEVGARQNDLHSISLPPGRDGATDEMQLTYLINGYLSSFYKSCFKPYLGGGIGYVHTSYAFHIDLPPNVGPPTFPAFLHPRKNAHSFAYQLSTGIQLQVKRNTALSLEYQYFDIPQLLIHTTAGVVNTHARSNNLFLRLTYFL